MSYRPKRIEFVKVAPSGTRSRTVVRLDGKPVGEIRGNAGKTILQLTSRGNPNNRLDKSLWPCTSINDAKQKARKLLLDEDT